MSTSLSKKRALEAPDANGLLLPINFLTEEQVAALQGARVNLPPAFHCLSPILEILLSAYEERMRNIPPHLKPAKTRAATDFNKNEDVTETLGIRYDEFSKDSWLDLKEVDTEAEPLDANYATVIKDLQTTRYINRSANEGTSRTVLNLIILDRLNKLQNQESIKNLRLNAEVSMAVKHTDEDGQSLIIRGQADWALGWGKTKTETDSLLVVVEAKSLQQGSIGMAQMVVYLAAVHAAREKKTNRTVFGMVSDANAYWFARLDDSKTLAISLPMIWSRQQNEILTYLDTILRNAIESSPHTTPSRRQNAVLHSYPSYLRRSWNSHEEKKEGEASGDLDDEPYVVDVLESSDGIVLRSVKR